jgi:hypothetical protein
MAFVYCLREGEGHIIFSTPSLIANGVSGLEPDAAGVVGQPKGDSDADLPPALDMRRDGGRASKNVSSSVRLVLGPTAGLQIELGMGSSANCDSSETVP